MDNVTKCLRSISDKELCYSEEGMRITVLPDPIGAFNTIVFLDAGSSVFSNNQSTASS